MFLVSTRNFPPELGGMQNLMEGLSNALINHGPVKVFADSFENSDSYFDWNDYNDLSNQNILYNNLNFPLNRKYILALFQIFYIPSSIENNENEFYSLAIDKTHLIVKLQRQWRKYQLKINKIKQNLPAYLNKRSIGLNDNSYNRCKKSKI